MLDQRVKRLQFVKLNVLDCLDYMQQDHFGPELPGKFVSQIDPGHGFLGQINRNQNPVKHSHLPFATSREQSPPGPQQLVESDWIIPQSFPTRETTSGIVRLCRVR